MKQSEGLFPRQLVGRGTRESVFARICSYQGGHHMGVWLSRIPMRIPGHFMVLGSTGAVRQAFERQAAEDWKFFLSLRAGELQSGARLVVVLPALNNDAPPGWSLFSGRANEVLAEMVAENA